MERQVFSPDAVAKLLGISQMTVYREIRRKKLPCARLGRMYIITRPDLEQWLGVQRIRAILGEAEEELEPAPAEKVHDGEPIVHADETHEWLDTVTQDTADRLAALETDLLPDELEAWHKAMARASKPARYLPGKGVVIEEEKV